MSEWKEYKLGSLVQTISDTYKFRDENEQVIFLNTSDIGYGKILNHPMVLVKDLPGQAKKRIQEGDLLFSEIRPANRRYALVTMNSEKYVVSTKLMVLRSRGDISNSFLKYFLSQDNVLDYLQVIAENRSGTFPQITFDQVADLDVNLPPLSEQSSIAGILSSLDDKIDLLHRQNKTLEGIAEAFWRKMFVEEADLGWKRVKLGDMASVSTGKGLKSTEYNENGLYPVIGANGEIGRTDKYLTNEKLILTGRVGTLGEVFISNKAVWISDNVLIVKPGNKKLFYPIYFLLRSIDFENLNVGSTQPLVTQTDLKSIEIRLPNNDALQFLGVYCETAFNKIEKNVAQISTLSGLRDTLLLKLMSGEVRVKI
ncbi:MAG: restriction endonuclease subunit S [Dehalococcoidales bacterium]|nr:restriction endonuclease subunit S [Dehalococcoidales bacterium]